MADERQALRWVLLVFEKDGDALVERRWLSDEVSLEHMQNVFDLPLKNPMYDSYPVGEQQASNLGSLLAKKPDFARFDYFLERDDDS